MNEQPSQNPQIFINPWWRIWIQPRQTIQQIIAIDPKMNFWVLVLFYGITRTASLAVDLTLGDVLPPSEIATFILIGGSLTGIIGIYFTASLFKIVGNLLGGIAESQHIRTVLAWATLPSNALTILSLIPLISLFGSDVFTSTNPQMHQLLFGQSLAADFIGQGLLAWRNLLELIGSIYYIVIVILGFAEVEKLSAWKAVGAFAIVFGAMLLLLAACFSLSVIS